MTPEELKLRCLELAIEQTRTRDVENFKTEVAELQTWLYNRVVSGSEVVLPQPADGQVATKRRPRNKWQER